MCCSLTGASPKAFDFGALNCQGSGSVPMPGSVKVVPMDEVSLLYQSMNGKWFLMSLPLAVKITIHTPSLNAFVN